MLLPLLLLLHLGAAGTAQRVPQDRADLLLLRLLPLLLP
jgi:hypothetical protein